MTPGGFLTVSLLSLGVAFLAAIASNVLKDIQWHELEDYSKRNDKLRFDAIHDNDEEVATGTETLLYLAIATHVFSGIAWISTSQFITFDSVGDSLLGVAVGTCVLLASVVWFPNAIAEHAGTKFLYHTWRGWQAIASVLRPFAYGAQGANFLIKRLMGVTEEESEEEALEEEIRTIVAEGQLDGLLDSDTRDMIEGVIELDDANVADIMTPRDKMDVMSVDLSWNEVLKYVTEVGRTRIPVYNGTPNEFIGVLYVKDLFAELSKPEQDRRSLHDILRTQWDVPMTMHLDELLQQFRQTRNHLALVSDEYNGVAGLVTIEDVLEEIVGEIVDESDKEDIAEIRIIGPHEAVVVGRAHVEEINEQVGCDLPEDDEFDTIGGFLMHRLGRVPKQGDTIHWHEMQITVLEASRRRAELVRICNEAAVPSDVLTSEG